MGGTFFIFLATITITHVSLLLNSVIALNPNKGFSLRMIHIDSKESPLYLGDHLTWDERLQRLVEQTRARARYIESQILLESNATHSMNPDIARLRTVYEAAMFYIAEVGLGNFPGSEPLYMNYYLMIDSGSVFTWLQCQGAAPTFTQDMPLYPWNLSTTFRPVTPVPCNKALCPSGRCNDFGQCTYVAGYVSGPISSGIVAKERFTLGSSTGAGALETMDLYVGCGLHQENFGVALGNNHKTRRRDLIAGILGLGRGPWSFLSQMSSAGQGRFSYCFEPSNRKIKASNTYLRFGADATTGTAARRVGETPLVERGKSRKTFYYLNLEDVSVGDKPVGFPRGTFELRNEAEGGTMIDSGAPLSLMYRPYFNKVVDLVRAHFENLKVEYIGRIGVADACFHGEFDSYNYPPITLHFQNANYVISDHRANFIRINANYFCFAYFARESKRPAFKLGALQQINKRIVYDTMDERLSFRDEDCRLDPSN
ncbi:aspartic proteinase CDR1-like [Papaver somniferum]|uniref:aspartic proteinase CDR1-like n=1 Tax=Papaver somniferum TaxID=3469 RepID=UPI000E70168B|nr:aspartic proteinase CDR1-like [Papaver somniferum]